MSSTLGRTPPRRRRRARARTSTCFPWRAGLPSSAPPSRDPARHHRAHDRDAHSLLQIHSLRRQHAAAGADLGGRGPARRRSGEATVRMRPYLDLPVSPGPRPAPVDGRGRRGRRHRHGVRQFSRRGGLLRRARGGGAGRLQRENGDRSNQVAVINEVFTQAAAEIAELEEIVQAFKDNPQAGVIAIRVTWSLGPTSRAPSACRPAPRRPNHKRTLYSAGRRSGKAVVQGLARSLDERPVRPSRRTRSALLAGPIIATELMPPGLVAREAVNGSMPA